MDVVLGFHPKSWGVYTVEIEVGEVVVHKGCQMRVM